MSKRKSIPESVKKTVASRQVFKCANNPNSNLKGLENYDCPQWQKDEDKGIFDEACYNIDHITEITIGGTNDIDNLQALCVPCHSVKTRMFYVDKYFDDCNQDNFNQDTEFNNKMDVNKHIKDTFTGNNSSTNDKKECKYNCMDNDHILRN